MATEVPSVSDRKAKIQKLLEEDGFIEILEKTIDNAQGKVIVSKKYANCNAIIIVENSNYRDNGRKKR